MKGVLFLTDLNGWFQRGMTADEYIKAMSRNRNEMLAIYEQFTLTAEDQSRLESLKPQKWRAIVLTEDWCGDALLNNPILMRITEAAGMELRFILRDQNLELMDQYLTNGTSRAIPIFIFINQEGTEVGVWGPRAPEMQSMVDKGRAELPDKGASDFQEKQLELYKRLGAAYQTDAGIWHSVANSIMTLLLK